jgi:carbon-monoxide dehydrogenase medium subunit
VGALAPQNPGKSILDLPELQNTHICLKKVPLLDLYLGPGRTALKTGQLLVHFTLPLAESGQGSSFQRVMRLQGVALPVLNLAVWLRREGEIITDLRIMVGPAGPTPQRALAAEHALRGRRLTPESLADAQAALLTETHFRTSPRRATADYRRHLTGILLQDALSVAWKRAA